MENKQPQKNRVFAVLFVLFISLGIFTYAFLEGNPSAGNNVGVTQVSVTSTPEPTLTTSVVNLTQEPTQTPLPTPVLGKGMWISQSEVLSLKTTGSAWENIRTIAYGRWGRPNLNNQDSKHSINTLAGALTYVRLGDESLRAKVRDAIVNAKRTLDESHEWHTSNGVLSASRQLGAYIIAADLIDLESYDPDFDREFREWLGFIRTSDIGTHSRWKSITYTCENAAGNWGGFACASRIAASIYLGDDADVQRAASVLQAWMGERQNYPADAPGENGYFQHTSDYQPSWSCNEAVWTAVNPPCVKLDINIDGALVEDASRGGACCTLKGEGASYSWEVLQGAFLSAELLYRTGDFGNPYEWSDQALKRAIDFLDRSGWEITDPAAFVPWLANARYGTSYPTSSTSDGRIMSWGDWLYQE